MKLVINRCYGGYGLSPAAVRRLAELNGKECYFFSLDFKTGTYSPLTQEEATARKPVLDRLPNPNEVIGKSHRDEDGSYKTYNELFNKYGLPSRPDDRTDPKLIQVVEELGGEHRKGASGSCAELKIIEIPDGVEYEIDEYDGVETVHEIHASWS